MLIQSDNSQGDNISMETEVVGIGEPAEAAIDVCSKLKMNFFGFIDRSTLSIPTANCKLEMVFELVTSSEMP